MAEPTQSDRIATNGSPTAKPRKLRARLKSPKAEASGPAAAPMTAAAGSTAVSNNLAVNMNGFEAVIADTVAITQGGAATSPLTA